jgi:hypothetical protein
MLRFSHKNPAFLIIKMTNLNLFVINVKQYYRIKYYSISTEIDAPKISNLGIKSTAEIIEITKTIKNF